MLQRNVCTILYCKIVSSHLFYYLVYSYSGALNPYIRYNVRMWNHIKIRSTFSFHPVFFPIMRPILRALGISFFRKDVKDFFMGVARKAMKLRKEEHDQVKLWRKLAFLFLVGLPQLLHLHIRHLINHFTLISSSSSPPPPPPHSPPPPSFLSLLLLGVLHCLVDLCFVWFLLLPRSSRRFLMCSSCLCFSHGQTFSS